MALDVKPELVVHVDVVLGSFVLHHKFEHMWCGFKKTAPRRVCCPVMGQFLDLVWTWQN